jgi:hypothetical protein
MDNIVYPIAIRVYGNIVGRLELAEYPSNKPIVLINQLRDGDICITINNDYQLHQDNIISYYAYMFWNFVRNLSFNYQLT